MFALPVDVFGKRETFEERKGGERIYNAVSHASSVAL